MNSPDDVPGGDRTTASGTRWSRRFLFVAIAAPTLVPIAVFTAVALTSGMGVGGSVRALAEQSMERRQNPVITGVLGLFPVALLLASLWFVRRSGRAGAWLPAAAWSGLVAILLVLGWANVQFWPLFLPDRVYPGFPHGLELVIGPLFFAPVAMVVGVFGAVLAARWRK